jgi:hypothetical protein
MQLDSFHRQNVQGLAGLSCTRELRARVFSHPLIDFRLNQIPLHCHDLLTHGRSLSPNSMHLASPPSFAVR